MSRKMFIGIDGGASKTAGTLIDSSGTMLARTRSSGSAVVGKPSAESLEVLSRVFRALLDQIGAQRKDIARVGIGLNGVDFENEVPMQSREIASALGIGSDAVALVNDGIVALWGATAAPAACILQHGSGFTAAWRKEYGGERLFDHLNRGQIFDLRSRALAVVARMIDGRETPSPLKDKVLRHLGVPDEKDYAEAIYMDRTPMAKRMSVAPLVFELWQAGDPAAGRLVDQALDDYACAARAMIDNIGMQEADAVFGGGVITCAPAAFWAALREKMKQCCPAASAKAPELDPDVGAALMAAHHAGLDAANLYERVRTNPGTAAGETLVEELCTAHGLSLK